MQSETGVRELQGDVAAIRKILGQYGRLAAGADDLQEDSNLYLAGLTSLATVNVMLALEKHFDVEFPDALLGRQTFTSIESIAAAIAELSR